MVEASAGVGMSRGSTADGKFFSMWLGVLVFSFYQLLGQVAVLRAPPRKLLGGALDTTGVLGDILRPRMISLASL